MRNYKKTLIRYHHLFLPAVLVVSLVIGWTFFLPRFEQIKGIYDSLQKERESVSKLQAKIQDLETLNEFELSEKSERLLTALPSLKNPVGMMMMVDQLAEENSLLVEELKVSPGEVATEAAEIAEVGELVFKLTLSGSISQFLNFLKVANQSLPLVNLQIKNFDISGQNFSTDVTLVGYYSGLPKTLGKTEAPVPKLTSEEERFLNQLREYHLYQTETFEPLPGGKPNPFTY
jgi:Tfp pilus assembly protein PilO